MRKHTWRMDHYRGPCPPVLRDGRVDVQAAAWAPAFTESDEYFRGAGSESDSSGSCEDCLSSTHLLVGSRVYVTRRLPGARGFLRERDLRRQVARGRSRRTRVGAASSHGCGPRG